MLRIVQVSCHPCVYSCRVRWIGTKRAYLVAIMKKSFPVFPRAILFGGWVWFGTIASGAAPTEPVVLSVGIVPQTSATELVKLWAPVLGYLSEKTGYQLRFETAKDIPTFERRLVDGAYDIAYMSPYTYTVVHRSRAGYRAFAREKDKKLTGIIVVRKDSPYRTLADLAGKTLAFPSEAAIAASVLPRAHFEKQAIAITPKYVESHNSVYLSVAKGLYAAGGGVMRTFELTHPVAREQLRVLWTSPGYTPHPFVAHKRIPKAVVARLQAAMFAMDGDDSGRALLKRIAFKGIMPAKDADYDDLRVLGVTISEHLLK